MSIEDEPLDSFYPTCFVCGDIITGDGYRTSDGDYICEDCIKHINGVEEAEERRESAYADSTERQNRT